MIRDIPEIVSLDTRAGMIRIPPELDVPMTSRLRAVMDTATFRRLAGISQLGLVSLVYPAAHHSRFEHSLGVYRLGLLYLRKLSEQAEFRGLVSEESAMRLILATLLHDVGHWPFCHPIEDLSLPGIPSHEELARQHLLGSELADVIHQEWSIDPATIADLLAGRSDDASERLLSSILSGPIDCDKMDYLMRDSLHAGVPYGRNFDQARLIGSLCLNSNLDGLALTSKGKTAAEMMVFARYVMFSEVYWHRAVRSATAMFQRAFYRLYRGLALDELFCQNEETFIRCMREAESTSATQSLLEGLFGRRRLLFKQCREYSYFDAPEVYAKLARQPYPRLVEISARVAAELKRVVGREVSPDEVLIDAPPAKLEVQFHVQIRDTESGDCRELTDLSPVVKTLAETQFDDYVKRVRVFVPEEVRERLAGRGNMRSEMDRIVGGLL